MGRKIQRDTCSLLARVIREGYSRKIRISGRPGKGDKTTIGLEKLKERGILNVENSKGGERSKS